MQGKESAGGTWDWSYESCNRAVIGNPGSPRQLDLGTGWEEQENRGPNPGSPRKTFEKRGSKAVRVCEID